VRFAEQIDVEEAVDVLLHADLLLQKHVCRLDEIIFDLCDFTTFLFDSGDDSGTHNEDKFIKIQKQSMQIKIKTQNGAAYSVRADAHML